MLLIAFAGLVVNIVVARLTLSRDAHSLEFTRAALLRGTYSAICLPGGRVAGRRGDPLHRLDNTDRPDPARYRLALLILGSTFKSAGNTALHVLLDGCAVPACVSLERRPDTDWLRVAMSSTHDLPVWSLGGERTALVGGTPAGRRPVAVRPLVLIVPAAAPTAP